jgi:hypothetical protein
MKDRRGKKYLEINCLYAFLFIFLRLKIGQLSNTNGYGIYTNSETGPRNTDSDLFLFKMSFSSPLRHIVKRKEIPQYSFALF